MYAVIQTGGKQYRVAPGSTLRVEKLDADEGASVELDRVLMITDGDDVQVGTPYLPGGKVTATVKAHGRGDITGMLGMDDGGAELNSDEVMNKCREVIKEALKSSGGYSRANFLVSLSKDTELLKSTLEKTKTYDKYFDASRFVTEIARFGEEGVELGAVGIGGEEQCRCEGCAAGEVAAEGEIE